MPSSTRACTRRKPRPPFSPRSPRPASRWTTCGACSSRIFIRITSGWRGRSSSRVDRVGDFLDALGAGRTLPVTRVLPAHGDPVDDLPGRVDQILAHHEDRLRATLDAIGDAERDAYAVCRTLFPVLRSAHEERFALAETLAHLRYLERRGKV